LGDVYKSPNDTAMIFFICFLNDIHSSVQERFEWGKTTYGSFQLHGHPLNNLMIKLIIMGQRDSPVSRLGIDWEYALESEIQSGKGVLVD